MSKEQRTFTIATADCEATLGEGAALSMSFDAESIGLDNATIIIAIANGAISLRQPLSGKVIAEISINTQANAK